MAAGRRITLRPSKSVAIKYAGKRRGKGFSISLRRKAGNVHLSLKKGKRVLRFCLCRRAVKKAASKKGRKAALRHIKLRVKVSAKARSISINGIQIKFKSLKALLKLVVLLGLKKAAASVRRQIKAKKATKKGKKGAKKAAKKGARKGAKKSKKARKSKKGARKGAKKSKKARKSKKGARKGKKARKSRKGARKGKRAAKK